MKNKTASLEANPNVNRDAADGVPTPEDVTGGSGSTYCSPLRYFEHSTICQVCDLLGLPHPQEDSHTLMIQIDVDERSDTCGEEKVWMSESRELSHNGPLKSE